jgi:hypothetical protein
MSRVNQPDTLLTELREIQRRLRILESGRPAAAAAVARAAAAAPPAPFLPARTADWPATTATEWTPLVRVLANPGTYQVVVEHVADAETAGRLRVVVAGEPGEAVAATAEPNRSPIAVTAADSPTEIVVEAHRTDGTGAVRAVAFLLPRS